MPFLSLRVRRHHAPCHTFFSHFASSSHVIHHIPAAAATITEETRPGCCDSKSHQEHPQPRCCRSGASSDSLMQMQMQRSYSVVVVPTTTSNCSRNSHANELLKNEKRTPGNMRRIEQCHSHPAKSLARRQTRTQKASKGNNAAKALDMVQ